MYGKQPTVRKTDRYLKTDRYDHTTRPGRFVGRRGSISLSVMPGADETVLTGRGCLDRDTVLGIINTRGFGATRHNIWDLRKASLSGLDHDALTEIATRLARTDDTRRTAATAIIVSNSQARLLIQLFREIARHRAGRAVPLYVASDFTDARQWLNDATVLNRA